jgi:hypothetical protein
MKGGRAGVETPLAGKRRENRRFPAIFLPKDGFPGLSALLPNNTFSVVSDGAIGDEAAVEAGGLKNNRQATNVCTDTYSVQLLSV